MKWRSRIIKGALIAAGVVLLGLIQAGFFDRLYHYPYAEHFRVRILPGAAYNLAVAVIFYLILLLVALIRRPRPAIRYRRDKDIVIDNA